MEEPREPRRSRREDEHFSPQRRRSQREEQERVQQPMQEIQELQEQLPVGKYNQNFPNFVNYVYDWILFADHPSSYFNYYTYDPWYTTFVQFGLEPLQIDDPNHFNSVARGFFYALCRYIDICRGIPFNGLPVFIFSPDGNYQTLTSETSSQVINMITTEQNTLIDPTFDSQLIQFTVKCRDMDIHIPFILQGTYLKVTVTENDYHNFEDDFQNFKFMFLNYFNNFDIIEPQFDDIRWYNDTLTTNPRRIEYNFNIPNFEPLVEVQNQPLHVIIPEHQPEPQRPLEVTEFHFTSENDGITEETHYIYPDIEGQVTNTIQNENYRPVPQQEQEQITQVINALDQPQQHGVQPMEEEQQNADGTWVDLNDIRQVHVDYILPQHYGDNHVVVGGIETVSVFNDDGFVIRKTKGGNIIYLEFEWNVIFENFMINEKIISDARKQTHLGTGGKIFVSERDVERKGNPNVYASAIIGKLAKYYKGNDFKEKLYANLSMQLYTVPVEYQDDYSSLSFFKTASKIVFDKFIKMFHIIEFLHRQDRVIPFVYTFKMEKHKQITVLPKSFVGNVLYGKQRYEGKEYPFFMALEVIHNITDFDPFKRSYVIITNLIRIKNTRKEVKLTNPGIKINPTKGFLPEFQNIAETFETATSENVVEIDVKRHNVKPENIQLQVKLVLKFAEVYTNGNEQRERVFIKPDYLINDDTNWKFCPYLFMDEYYSLLQYIEINILNYADRKQQIINHHLQLRQQNNEQVQEQVTPQQNEQQEGEPTINEANVNDNWNLDGNTNGFNFEFDSDEYYDGFNHP